MYSLDSALQLIKLNGLITLKCKYKRKALHIAVDICNIVRKQGLMSDGLNFLNKNWASLGY